MKALFKTTSHILSIIFLFLLIQHDNLHAQAPPKCSAAETKGDNDPADEYYKAISKACFGLNAENYDSVRYYLEKAIFFEGFAPMPKNKRQQLLNHLGKDKFTKLACFCENPAETALPGDSATSQPGIIQTPSQLENKSAGTMYESDPSNIELDEKTKKDLEAKAVIKCNQFVEYIKTITGENSDQDAIKNAIESGVALFVNEQSTVEVSSRNKRETKKITVRQYFQKLSALRGYYDRISIIGSSYYIVQGLRKAPDGNYYTLVSFEQIFTGFNKEQIAYTDMTRKNIIVMVLKMNKMEEGSMKIVWDVLLKEVQVVETI